MKFRIWMVLAVFISLFAFAACGGGGEDNSGESSECSGGEEATKTPAQVREAQVDKLVGAFEDLDGGTVKELFHPEHHDLADERIVGGLDEMKENGGTWTIDPSDIVEEDDKFIVPITMTITMGEQSQDDERQLELVEHEGKWLFKFYQ